jgi:hypothetical protein
MDERVGHRLKGGRYGARSTNYPRIPYFIVSVRVYEDASYGL